MAMGLTIGAGEYAGGKARIIARDCGYGVTISTEYWAGEWYDDGTESVWLQGDDAQALRDDLEVVDARPASSFANISYDEVVQAILDAYLPES